MPRALIPGKDKPDRRTREVFETLLQVAQGKGPHGEQRFITYDELAAATGLMRYGMGRQLLYIHHHVCVPHHLPYLTTVVVRNDGTPLPGIWNPLWTDTQQRMPDEDLHRMALAEVRAYEHWPEQSWDSLVP